MLRRLGRSPFWVLVLVGLLHLPSLFNPFVADDYVFVDKGKHLSWSDIPEVLTTPILNQEASGVWWTPDGVLPFYRPIALLTFALEYQIWGTNPFGYHLTNLAIHLLCAYLVWLLALRLTGDRALSVAAAVVFGIHPAHSEAVLWISGRFDVLVGAFMMSSVLAYLKWQEGSRHGAVWAVVSLACFAIGLGCKETALVLPAVVVVGECLGWRGPQARYRFSSLATAGVLMGMVALAYLGVRFWIFGGMGELPPPYGVDLTEPTAPLVILRSMAEYLLDFVLFLQIDAFYLDGFWAHHVGLLLAFVTFAGLLILWGWRLAGPRRPFRVGLAWAVLFSAPSLLAMPGERNIYLPMAGISIAAASVLAAAWKRAESRPVSTRRVKRVAGALLLLATVIAGLDQVIMWGVADASQQVYDDLRAALPDPPAGSRIYVVNQCPLNAGGFIQGVRLLYGRDDIVACALALSPQIQATTSDVLYRTGSSSVKIVRHNGYFFRSFLEKFALFSRPVSTLSQSARRLGLELLTPLKSLEDVRELELQMPGNLDDGQLYFFVWDNGRLGSVMDLMWRAKWPRLVRCPILDPPAAVVRN